MQTWHWLRDDMKAGHGGEQAWTVGEEREIKGHIVICDRGYHSSPTPWHGLEYAPGSVLCLVEIGEPEAKQEDKFVSRTRKLLAFANVEKELRQFAIDCAERALNREREHGREPDARSWAAIEAAKAFLRGEITPEELAAAQAAARAARDAAWAAAWAAARDAAWAAARAAARAAAWDAARDAAWAAARDAARAAAWAAAWAAEREWQQQRFEELIQPRVDAMLRTTAEVSS